MADEDNHAAETIEQVLSLDKKSTGRQRFRLWAGAVTVLLLLMAAWVSMNTGQNPAIHFDTAAVTRGDLTITVTATGKLEPVNQVEVGTEVSGTVESVNADYNDRVKTGQVLARLDTEQLEARHRQSSAALDLAKARVKEAEATLTETFNNFERAKQLALKDLRSQEERDAAEASYKRALAAHASAKAQVTQAAAQLDADKTALDKAVILSPINGIVLKRSVEPGQTVAASFQSPVLFTLAEDLSKMELHVDIDEADVGQVQADQTASFTVDAYPDQHFSARILKVYYAPQIVQDVVTYEALLSVDNSALLLRPGMTATANINTRQVNNALLVPNAALRFDPPQVISSERSVLSSIFPWARTQPDKKQKVVLTEKTQQRVWTLQNGEPVAHPVTIGVTDKRMTEILDGDLQPGMELLVDIIAATR